MPHYIDNGVANCFAYSLLFWLGGNVGPFEVVKEQLLLAVRNIIIVIS